MAVALGDAGVHLLVLHRSLEEALARLTCEQAIVVTGHAVTAHRTLLLDAVLRVGGGRGGGHRHDGYIRGHGVRAERGTHREDGLLGRVRAAVVGGVGKPEGSIAWRVVVVH